MNARTLLSQLVAPQKWAIALDVVLTVCATVANVIGPVFIARAIDSGLPHAQAGDFTPLINNLGIFLTVTLAGGIATFASNRYTGYIAQRIVYNLRMRMYRHVQSADIAYHESTTSGRLIARQTSDMESVQTFLSYGLIETVFAVLHMVAIAIMLLFLNVPLALVVLVGLVPLAGITVWAGRRQQTAYRATRTAIAQVIGHFTETMGGIRAVQAFRRQPAGRAKLTAEDSGYRDANAHALRAMAAFSGLTRLVTNVCQIAVILVGAFMVINGHTEVGVLTAFLMSLRRFYGPLDELVQNVNLYQSAKAALEKIAAVLAVSPTVTTRPGSEKELPETTSGRRIEFTGVEFAYADGTTVLPRMDLTVGAGQTVALVGATGAGKSTLVKLITRFYDPSEGVVSVDGVDLRDISDAELRRNIVMVTQESFLFSGSIADNIRVGKPDATDAEVEDAARAVGLHDYVAGLPDGYNTDVKKRGGRLSSGQRQLVSFARVFLADPRVIVLDEATAHLDIPTERLVQKALESVLADRTAIIIAHRLSTVAIADRVLVIDAGRVVEDGTTDELIHARGRFSQLHSAWRDTLA
ncbi:ABC transporter, ATP-binding protein [Brevibacterium mcbrellneri ATCC 49030]|uniref:ABC transporter, ATP-binding protein n=1 Tax=Brevibacterium mcbrellneri ATCC 49030 TaxID=585530 RepID=D4YKP5_9MICO|nr:ABC transporter ATP-binding protein [Brevibacterium mcbrellneri]EFG48248.1 ABC transporter, ATP-binding protein [Brevibacterium mcbrellneri ATCC 49030]